MWIHSTIILASPLAKRCHLFASSWRPSCDRRRADLVAKNATVKSKLPLMNILNVLYKRRHLPCLPFIVTPGCREALNFAYESDTFVWLTSWYYPFNFSFSSAATTTQFVLRLRVGLNVRIFQNIHYDFPQTYLVSVEIHHKLHYWGIYFFLLCFWHLPKGAHRFKSCFFPAFNIVDWS